MNRKDIIIIAVLINAGLLVTLFVSSLTEEVREEPPFSPSVITEVEHKILPPPSPEKEQLDQVIRQFAALPKQEEKKEEYIPAPAFMPPAKVEEKVSLAPSTHVVTVEKGDVLEKIARTYGVSVDEIMRMNHLSNSRLQIGQELKLPERKAPKKDLPPMKEEGSYYVVKSGDNPWTIAQKNGMQVEELLRLNQISEEKAKKLRPGDRLKIK